MSDRNFVNGESHNEVEVSNWGFVTGIVPLLVSLSGVAYFLWNLEILGLVLFGVSAVTLVIGIFGWANEYFSKGEEGKLGAIGIIWFIVAESAIFGAIFASFIVSRVNNASNWAEWIPEGGMNLVLLAILTLILWSSSYTIYKAEKAYKNFKEVEYRFWLIFTFVLGTVFVILHSFEWSKLYSEGFTIDSNPYGSGFFILTGIHASHVLVGLVLHAIMFVNSFKPKRSITFVKASTYYWHFVDIMWLFVAGLAYIVGSYYDLLF